MPTNIYLQIRLYKNDFNSISLIGKRYKNGHASMTMVLIVNWLSQLVEFLTATQFAYGFLYGLRCYK